MRDNKWVRLLAYVTGLVNQRTENRILRSHLPARLRLSDPERSTLAEIGKRLGRKDLQLVAFAALPDTLMAWYRRLIAQKFERIQTPLLSGSSPDHARNRSSHRSDGPRELWLGIRPHRGRSG